MEETVMQLRLVRAAAWTRNSTMDQLNMATHHLTESCREAHAAGVQKQQIAEAAGITRATLDRWLQKDL